jgi:hypothetical protein
MADKYFSGKFIVIIFVFYSSVFSFRLFLIFGKFNVSRSAGDLPGNPTRSRLQRGSANTLEFTPELPRWLPTLALELLIFKK